MSKVVDHFTASDMISPKQAHHAAMWLIADKLLTSPGLRISHADLALSNDERMFLKCSPVFAFHRGYVTFYSRACATYAEHVAHTRRAESEPMTNTWWRVFGY